MCSVLSSSLAECSNEDSARVRSLPLFWSCDLISVPTHTQKTTFCLCRLTSTEEAEDSTVNRCGSNGSTPQTHSSPVVCWATDPHWEQATLPHLVTRAELFSRKRLTQALLCNNHRTLVQYLLTQILDTI